MNSFEHDFTAELEKYVNGSYIPLPVLQTWNPGKIAPPEIHVTRGAAAKVPFESMNYQLRRSETFNRINDMLSLSLSETYIESIAKIPLDTEKVQVWLFARWWFNSYCEYLLDPLTQRSKFYKERHDEFLALMRHMLEFNSARRLTFRAALSAWFPESDLLTTEDQSDNDDASDDDADDAVAASPPPAPAPVTVQPASTGRRLALKGWGDHEARSKTRKNRNS